MREELRIVSKDAPTRIIVFENGKKGKPSKPTELKDEDYEYLMKKKNCPFSWFIDQGIFIVVDSVVSESTDQPSKADLAIEALQTQKANLEGKGKSLPEKAEKKLKALLLEKEETKTMTTQG